MYYFVAPLLMVCTCFIFALALFWFQSLRSKFFYKTVTSIDEATHVEIEGVTTSEP